MRGTEGSLISFTRKDNVPQEKYMCVCVCFKMNIPIFFPGSAVIVVPMQAC